MAGDDEWPDDMPPVNKSLDLGEDSGLDDEVEEELAEVIDETVDEDTGGKGSDENLMLYIGGEQMVFFKHGGCERCGRDAAGVLYSDDNNLRNIPGKAHPLCRECKDSVSPDHESDGFEWEEF